MELGVAGLKEQPFRTHGRPLVFVHYGGQEKASDFLRATHAHNSGLGLFQGPSLSGKTTIIHQFAKQLETTCAVAVVDGAGVNTITLLESVLRDYGYGHKFDTVNELLSMLKVFIQQQTVSGQPPMLVIENIHEMNPSAMRVLCELASVRVREKFALRIVLVSDRPIDYLVEAQAMEGIKKRLTGSFHLDPLTMDETCDYLHKKMRHGGCLNPSLVFPDDICDELYRASGGWPGIVDRLALLALARAETSSIELKHIEYPTIPESTRSRVSEIKPAGTGSQPAKDPVLRLTYNGEILQEFTFRGSRLLIGRSEHNDLKIESEFISRHHILLVRHGASTLLMDLNSANGTYVNSWRVANKILAHEDTIMIGDHGIKFIHEGAPDQAVLEGVGFDDTIVRSTVKDLLNVYEDDDTTLMPDRKVMQDSAVDNP
jgi:type II secretory pathway predicted ATPase ExeA/pSer/pThr/pTyr-binding forkhead associated (FHA) protein